MQSKQSSYIRSGPPGPVEMLAEIIKYKSLFWNLVWRDISVRYKQTLIGFTWMIINPLFTTFVFSGIFNHIGKISSGKTPYSIFVLSGIIPWTFFAKSMNRAGQSYIANTKLITKIYFPRILIPTATVLAGSLDFLISLVVLFVLMAFYHQVPPVAILALPLAFAWLLIFSSGLGLLFANLNIRFRDIGYALDYFIRMWMFLTPVVYPLSAIPERFRFLAMINPMTGLIGIFRWCLVGTPIDMKPLVVSGTFSIFVIFASLHHYRLTHKTFADII